MARQEADREDLFNEARALSERIELKLPATADSIVAGFRSTGALSVYFGADPAYHFNGQRELRRAYAGGRLIKADGRALVVMKRQRGEHEVVLRSRRMAPMELQAFLTDLESRFDGLAEVLASQAYRVVAQTGAPGAVAERLARWLADRSRPILVAASPRVDG